MKGGRRVVSKTVFLLDVCFRCRLLPIDDLCLASAAKWSPLLVDKLCPISNRRRLLPLVLFIRFFASFRAFATLCTMHIGVTQSLDSPKKSKGDLS